MTAVLKRDPARWCFPPEPCQTFKHDFHLSATGDLLLVLNVASTYDWSDLKFIFYCSVAPNQDQPVVLVYSLRAVDIYRYGINCACPEPFYHFSSVRMGIEQMLSGVLIEMIMVLWNCSLLFPVVCRANSSHPPNCLCYLITTTVHKKVAHKCTCFILADEIRTMIIQSPQHPTRYSGSSVVKADRYKYVLTPTHTLIPSCWLQKSDSSLASFVWLKCKLNKFFTTLLRDSLKGNPRANFEPFKYENDNRVGAPDCGAEVWDLSRPPIENGRR